MNKLAVIITCEHAVNFIPPAYQLAFQPHQALLLTHRGYDIGAQSLARKLVADYHYPYFEATASRLLIDCNRSLRNRDCFSFISKAFEPAIKQSIIDNYYLPYRQAALACIQSTIQQAQTVLHLSIHSFTPNLNGIERQAEIGLLYHPGRPKEQNLAIQWQHWLQQQAPEFRVRRNYPYLGKGDGLTQYCRQQFPASAYLGIEIECNQALFTQASSQKRVEELFHLILRN